MTRPADHGEADAAEEAVGWVVGRSLRDHVAGLLGSAIGWTAYGMARLNLVSAANRLADLAIGLRREGHGAIRAIGLHSAAMGRLAGRRGRLLIHGRMAGAGPFAGRSFYATYDVAAFNRERALHLICRFEPDAVPGSLETEDGELDQDDPGAEGVLWIARGKTFYRQVDG